MHLPCEAPKDAPRRDSVCCRSSLGLGLCRRRCCLLCLGCGGLFGCFRCGGLFGFLVGGQLEGRSLLLQPLGLFRLSCRTSSSFGCLRGSLCRRGFLGLLRSSCSSGSFCLGRLLRISLPPSTSIVKEAAARTV
jgi:hypothetical protein